MAGGHVNRTQSPNTWLHRPSLRREDSPCQPGAVHTWRIAAIHACDRDANGVLDGPMPEPVLVSRVSWLEFATERRQDQIRSTAGGACLRGTPERKVPLLPFGRRTLRTAHADARVVPKIGEWDRWSGGSLPRCWLCF